MYCPKCGHQTVSDELRFCSYCGLKLLVVKAAIAESEDVHVPETKALTSQTHQTHQRDINLGVILMFAGVLLSAFVAGTNGLGLGREKGALLLGVFYLSLIIFSKPITKLIRKLLSWQDVDNLKASQKGLGLGATLMFLSTVALAMTSFFMYGRMKSTPLFVGVGLTFALLLFVSRYLLRGLQLLVEDSTLVSKSLNATDARSTLERATELPTLPAAQGSSLPLFATPRVTTAEIVAPSSITERTTNLLE